MKKRSRRASRFLIRLRKLGLICRNEPIYPPKPRISHTVYPDEGISTINAMQHNFLETKKIDGCKFNSEAQYCSSCGFGLSEFLEEGCNQNLN